MKIIKSNTYNIINPEPFEIPFPFTFELLSGNTLLVQYTISEESVVDYSFNPGANDKILTSTRRALTLNDIYFLFTSRIFPDKTPYTAFELERFGIAEYHPYHIIRKTRGMMPGDKYWFRFEDEELNYKAALQEHREYYENSYKKYMESLEPPAAEPAAEEAAPPPETPAAVDGDVMSEDMINSLMSSFGEEAIPAEPASGTLFEPDSGTHDKMSDDAIAALLAGTQESAPAPAPEPAPTGEKMSDEDIAALLAQTKEANGVESKMSEDDIAALFASAGTETPAEPEPEPTPVAEEAPGGNMSPDAIAALLAANSAPAEPEPAPAPVAEETPGGNMSPDAIAAMLAAAQGVASEPEPEPTPVAEEAPGGNMSPDAIAAMLAAAQGAASEPEPEPAPAPEPAPSNEKMSDDAIAALFANN